MSSPVQPPPPNIRSPSVSSQPPPTSVVASPYSHHLPPPNLPPTSGPLPPPPRVTELPSILSSSPRSSSSPSSFHPLPPASSLQDHHGVLPPIPPPPSSSNNSNSNSYPERNNSLGRSSISHPLPPPPPPPQSSSNTGMTTTTTSTTTAQQTSSPPTANTNAGYRPLNVRDALTYLDQVKVRFSDQPDVYNRFLDIMKDFKSQAIDTPGVIERVSSLFKGHPTLISGFNTFLPPGYRIECSTNPREPDLITVMMPNGITTTTTAGAPYRETTNTTTAQQQQQQQPQHLPQPYYYPMHPPPPPPPSNIHGLHGPINTTNQPLYHHRPPPPPPPPPQRSSSPTPSSSSIEKRSPVEFNHAINYTRFAHDPEVYKQFLEILQTYQKDQKPIQEVYAHVQYLFHNTPDLLDEFKQFLPDITGQPGVLFDSISPNYYGSKRGHLDSTSLPPGKKKRTNNTTAKNKKLYQKDNDIVMRDPYSYPTSTFDPVRPAVSTEEVEFFERIRKHIGNKPSYEEFLKTLNLYTQHILDLDTLVAQVGIFIGNNKELYDWFKSIVSYEPKERPIEKPAHPLPKPDLAHCKATRESPSYRVVPQEWQTQPCSGRDQLAWEVLNDEYVSHPIWASEDDGFVASKKSQYEEAMHRCEEERYDYNMHIDANLNVIALLEPIALRIEQMTPEERTAFRLKPGLGGQSVTIYERIIKKVYDKERGLEIIELLYSNPAQVVPILLKRLKQKDEEWKRAQREWNKIWRELDAKNYYKALDYQGITFKSNDRKAMAPKALVSEIEGLRHDKKSKESSTKAIVSTVPFQFKFEMGDPNILKDITRIVFSFIDRQSGYTSSDREKIRTFIQTFLPLCFQVDTVLPEGIHYETEEEVEEEEEEDDMHSTNTEESESDIGRSPRKSPRRRSGRRNHEDEHTMDLLRDVLTKNHPNSDEDPTSNSSLFANISSTTTSTTAAVAATIAATTSLPPRSNKTPSSFFCNTTFYCFFRSYTMLYERLAKLRALDAEMSSDPRQGKRMSKVARDLGLYSSRFDDVDVSRGYYQSILDMMDRFFDGEMDQQVFEEQTRYVFVTDAYLIFTVDKLVHSMVKQIQAITVDPKSVELIRLFRSDKGLETLSPRVLSVYRLRAEDIVGSEENLYKINFENEKMTIQLIGKDDYMMDVSAADRYEDYVASYMDWVNVTEGVDRSSMKPTFLSR
ncbi:MAG: hypothetical protein EXX96DRAFT_475954 [Benjaminiella poitrasii]|nr:MAG: hypothetical protein EXX96DRAFT_475954 [Benjaminiella poitrasii]